jgi:hypothetical protein
LKQYIAKVQSKKQNKSPMLQDNGSDIPEKDIQSNSSPSLEGEDKELDDEIEEDPQVDWSWVGTLLDSPSTNHHLVT